MNAYTSKMRRFAYTAMLAVACIAAIMPMCAYADDDGDYIDLPRTSAYGNMVAEVLVSARSSAMSLSDLAINAAGPFVSNPALTARLDAPELHMSYASYYGNIFSASVMNYVSPIGSGSGITASAAYLLIPGIEDTRGIDVGALNSDDIKTFSASDVWVRAGYGHNFETGYADLYAGAAVTARRRNLGDASGYGLGADLGVVAHFKKPAFYVGLLWENIKSGTVWWQDSDYSERVPQHMRLSFAFEHEDPYIYGRISLFYTSPDLFFNEGINYQGQAGDSEEGRTPEVSGDAGILLSAGRYGMEYTIMNTLILRAGMSNSGYTLGAGVNLFNGRAGTDFSYVNHELAGTVKVSVIYRWM